jgi:hypothetical protein
LVEDICELYLKFIASDVRDRQFRIHGMDCAEEVAILKREVGPIVGSADRLAFDILNGKMIVRSDADGCWCINPVRDKAGLFIGSLPNTL